VPIVLLFIASIITIRSGIELRRFTVISNDELEFSVQFDRLLSDEVARIARAFRSDQLRNIGAEVAMQPPKADTQLSGLETRAIAAIRQGEPKSIVSFWLAEMVQRIQNVGFRPEYTLSGTVVIRADEAIASAHFARIGRRGRVMALDASSTEAVTPGAQTSLSRTIASQSDAVIVMATYRRDVEYLANLARVLACKFFVCWMELESAKMAQRPLLWPTSWQTVHDYASAQNALETLQ
jgi:hypothetical protein